MKPRRLPERLSFGGRIPWTVGLLLVLTLAMSLLVAFGDRHAGSIFELVALQPEAVWRGQVWRVVTWAFVEPSPLKLIFSCLFLYWFGSELALDWGARRFLSVYAGIALTASIATCLIACVDGAVFTSSYLGGWAMGSAVTVAWGLWFPDRVIRIWFIIPIRGYVLAWLTVAFTVVYAVYYGWEHFLPELSAEAATLAWLYRGMFLVRWRKARAGMAAGREARRREAAKRDRAKKRAQSVAYLRVVESHDDDPPDLPPELDGKLDELLRGRGAKNRRQDN